MIPKLIPFRAGARFIVLSDCHRGDGSMGDEFAHNSLIYKCALEYYLENGFTYIELGDAEELWENPDLEPIYITHTSVYDLLRRFHDPDPARTRYLKVWGNHDEDWRKNPAPLRTLFPDIQIHEAILLINGDILGNREAIQVNGDIFDSREATGKVSPFKPILLFHGHQADPKCSGPGAKISRFLVRHVWAGLQKIGICDPTRAAENPGLSDNIDETLYSWAKGEEETRPFLSDKWGHLRGSRSDSQDKWGHLRGSRSEPQGVPIYPGNNGDFIIIAGHTHRPVFANLTLTERRRLETGVGTPGVRPKEKADPVYFNTGSCIHPRCITGIEITMEGQATPQNAKIQDLTPKLMLVKWGYAAAEGSSALPYPLSVTRTELEG